MDNKFHNIRTLALRPETGDGEAAAALNAARRMVATRGLDTLLGAESRERVVEKVVYRKRDYDGDCVNTLTITIKPQFQFSMIERIFQDAVKCSVDIEVVSCNGVDNLVNNGMVIKIKATGSERSVDAYSDLLKSYIDQAREKTKHKQQKPYEPKSNPAAKSKEKSWWDRLKEWPNS